MYQYLIVVLDYCTDNDRTETFGDESDAIKLYTELVEQEASKDYVMVFMITLNIDTGSVITNRQWRRA